MKNFRYFFPTVCLILLLAATASAATITSTTTGGNWNTGGTWVGGVVPIATDDVVIADGATVTIDVTTTCASLRVGQGASTVLQYQVTPAVTLTVTNDLTVMTLGVFTSPATGTTTTHALSLGGNLTNNGTLDFSTNTNTAGAGITFTGATSKTFNGNGAITDIRTITVNKGVSSASVLELSTTNFTVQGVTTNVAGFLTLTNGTFKLSGSFTGTNRVFTVAGYTIAATTGFWLNNSNYTVSGQNGSPILNGSLTITRGNFNVGTLAGNSLNFNTGSSYTMEGGTFIATGRFQGASTTQTTTFNMSGGTLTVVTLTNSINDRAAFDLQATGSSFTMSGGTIVIQDENTAGGSNTVDYRNQASTVSITGGTVQFGNSSTPAARSFVVAQSSGSNNAFPNLTIDPTQAHSVTLSQPITVRGNVTIGSGTSLLANSLAISIPGNTSPGTAPGNWTNNGTFTPGTQTTTFNGITNQTIGGSAATTFSTLTIANTGTGDEVVSLTSSALTTVSTALNVNDGVFDQGSSSDLTTNTVTIAAAGTLRNFGTGDLTLSGNLANAGTVRFSANGSPCGDTDDILIRSSVGGTQRSWSGAGTFALSDVNVQDQNSTAAIAVQSGTNNGNTTALWTFVACLSNTYTWNGGVLGSWIVAANWTPTRTLPAVNDVLIIDGTPTPAPIITNVPTQEIAALRMINGADPNLQAGAANNTLTISGRTGTDLEVPSGSVLTISTANALRLSITSGSIADVNGQIIFQDAAHRLLGNAASAILFHGTADFTTTTGFTGNAFGSGGGSGNGATGSVQFEIGSQYFHGAGDSPFGSAASPAVAVFQTGSEADWLANTGFQASGRTYATLVIGNASTEVDVSDSGTGNFQFNNLFVNSTASQDSSLTFTGSGTSTVTIKGNITSSGTGINGTLADVNLTAGTGGIQIDAGGLITFGNQFSVARSIFFGSNATVVSGTTLNLSRLVQMGLSAEGIVTDNGAIVPNFSSVPGYILGAVRKPIVPATYVFPLGTVDGYTPVDVSGATGGGDLTVRAVNAPTSHPSVDDATSLDEYWTLTLNSGSLKTALTFNYLDTDVDGTESNYRVIRIEGSTIRNYDQTVLNTGANTATVTDISGFSDWTLGEPVAPSAVKFGRFNAASFADGVQLAWDSGFEVDNLGYHVYRERNGKRTRVTPSIVAGSALRVGKGNAMTAGYSYAWFDPQGTPDAVYHLEAIDLNGSRQWAGPVHPYAGQSGKPSPRRRAKLLNELITSPNAINSTLVRSWPAQMKAADAADMATSDSSLAVQQAIAAGQAVKLQVRSSGWYRVTQADLVSAGLDPNTDARTLQLFVDGVEVPMSLSSPSARLNNNDTIEFYGQPLDTPTTDARVYWLITGDSAGKRMIARRGKLKAFGDEADPSLRSFEVTVERRDKIVYFPNLLNGDRDNLFGAPIFSEPIDQTIAIHNLLVQSASQPQLEIALQGLTDGGHQVNVKLNGTDIGTMNLAGHGNAVETFTVDPTLLHEGDNVVTFASMNGDSDISLVDSIRLTYAHQYKAINNSLRFTAPAGRVVQIDGFSVPNIRVVDITDPNVPVQLSAMAAVAEGGYSVKIQTTGSGARTLLAFTEDQSGHPASITPNQPSTWNAATNGADMVVITHRDFRNAIEPLANLRRSQGLNVAVVDVEDVYDEFSYGAHTPAALKSFLLNAATDWQRKPQYLLLVGDSSWDPRNYLGEGANDFVPTKLIDTSSMETASDDWLADFEGFGLTNMAVGRLPGRTAGEVSLMVSKIMTYEQERELNSPLRSAVMVADNGFESQSLQTGNLLPAGVDVQNINRSQVGNDDVMRGQILDALNQGPMIVNYYGHGSVTVWTGAGLLDSDLATGLTNANRPSVYVMMTCLNGYASDAYIDSLGESTLKAQNGAVAVWASSGFTLPQPQFAMNTEFYRLLFGTQPVRLGEAARSAKAATSDLDVRRTWTLLGDPAMRIR